MSSGPQDRYAGSQRTSIAVPERLFPCHCHEISGSRFRRTFHPICVPHEIVPRFRGGSTGAVSPDNRRRPRYGFRTVGGPSTETLRDGMFVSAPQMGREGKKISEVRAKNPRVSSRRTVCRPGWETSARCVRPGLRGLRIEWSVRVGRVAARVAPTGRRRRGTCGRAGFSDPSP